MTLGRRFLSNIYDPRKDDANAYDAMGRDWDQHMKWVNANVRGRPKCTDKYTVEELEDMGMIGLYAPGLVEIDE